MAIENKIIQYIMGKSKRKKGPPRLQWFWSGKPHALDCKNDVFVQIKLLIIDFIIYDTDDTECLTSSSEYIRECKKWMMEEDFVGELNAHGWNINREKDRLNFTSPQTGEQMFWEEKDKE